LSSHLQTDAEDVAVKRTAKHRRNTLNTCWKENIKCVTYFLPAVGAEK